MGEDGPVTILCLASYEKGFDFMRAARRLGCRVLLLSITSLEHLAWPRESIDEIYFMPDLDNINAVINGVSYLARTHVIDRVVALDEYDIHIAAALREHLRLPGMGVSATWLVRDKLAMRTAAAAQGIPVPEFTAAFNDAQVHAYLAGVPPPWLIKPRAEASTIGIIRCEKADAVWSHLHELGDRRSHRLIERYVPATVYHVDSIIWQGELRFAEVHQYGRPPLDVFHSGGIAVTGTLRRDSADEAALQALNRQVIAALGPTDGVAHAEYLKASHDGRFYFLEIAARPGGAFIADVVEAAAGLNLWAEWAAIEKGQVRGGYELPERRHDYAGAIISLARQEQPDTSAYTDPEIIFRLEKPNHVGFILTSPEQERIDALLTRYTERFTADFLATMPPYTDRPPSDH